MSVKHAHIEIKKSKKTGKIWVRYVGKNGKLLAPSQLVLSYASALKNIRAMQGLFDSDNISVRDFHKNRLNVINRTGKIIAYSKL